MHCTYTHTQTQPRFGAAPSHLHRHSSNYNALGVVTMSIRQSPVIESIERAQKKLTI